MGWERRWDSPGRLLMGVRDGTGISGGLGIGWVGVPLGLGGGSDSPRRLLRGPGTVPGFIQVWVRGWVGWWVSPLGWERGWYSLG